MPEGVRRFITRLVSVRKADFRWTRGEPKRFQSSSVVKRGFCADCGTPLTYEAPDGVAVAAGAFDDPALFPPTLQYGTEAKSLLSIISRNCLAMIRLMISRRFHFSPISFPISTPITTLKTGPGEKS